ncbi:MAG: hypothetical protein IJ482_07445 [Alphaproteobacteria bacterium]|nr:hypothetical protein [Alphaproteobacteria bacterium]
MKKVFKVIIIVAGLVSILAATIAIVGHTMAPAKVATYLMILAAAIGAVYSLWKFSVQMVRKTDHPEKKRSDGTPAHRLWPMWAFLGFFLIEVALAAACIYFAKNMWCVRDLINFELTAIISAVVVYWFTHCLTKKA